MKQTTLIEKIALRVVHDLDMERENDLRENGTDPDQFEWVKKGYDDSRSNHQKR